MERRVFFKLWKPIRTILWALSVVLVLLVLLEFAAVYLEQQGLLWQELESDNPTSIFEIKGDTVQVVEPESDLTDEFTAIKPEGEFRMFILGDSFAQSFPYKTMCPMSRWIERELLLRYPTRRFRIINAGAGTPGSSDVLRIFNEALGYQPDAILVSMGNNETMAGSTPSHNYQDDKLALVRILRRALLDNVNQEPPVDLNPEQMRDIFCDNIRQMQRRARQANVELILATIPINHKDRAWGLMYRRAERLAELQSSRPLEDLELGDELEGAVRLFLQGDYAAAEQLVRGRIDPYSRYLRANCLEQLGMIDQAQGIYAGLNANLYLELFNQIVRQEAQRSKTTFIDLNELVMQMSVHGIADRNLYYDTCHLRWYGYSRLGMQIADVVDHNYLEGGTDELTTVDNAQHRARLAIFSKEQYIQDAAALGAGYLLLRMQVPLIDVFSYHMLH
ncbi:MAG: GDSL-type esterase/lipase family protein [Candidatus Alcyoniella australis]|nr:GDSL-type esterase/lipase family protein [Candidatus Alcyoniella australis]